MSPGCQDCQDCQESSASCRFCENGPEEGLQAVVLNILGSHPSDGLSRSCVLTATLPIADIDSRILSMVEGMKAYHRHLGLEVHSIQATRLTAVGGTLSGSGKPRLIPGTQPLQAQANPGSRTSGSGKLRLVSCDAPCSAAQHDVFGCPAR